MWESNQIHTTWNQISHFCMQLTWCKRARWLICRHFFIASLCKCEGSWCAVSWEQSEFVVVVVSHMRNSTVPDSGTYRLLVLRLTVWRSTFILLISPLCLNNCTVFNHFIHGGHDSLVGIATRLGLNGPGIETRCGATFSVSDHTGPEAHPVSYTVVTGGKAATSCCWLPITSRDEFGNCLELYLRLLFVPV